MSSKDAYMADHSPTLPELRKSQDEKSGISRFSHERTSPALTPRGNGFTRFRGAFREYAAEFLGTMVLVILGVGVNCQVGLSSSTTVRDSPAGNWTSVSFGWGAAVALGAWISGGHMNPAFTLAMAVWRGFPWKKVPGYIFSQFFGAFIGAAIVYANYFHAINAFEGGSGIRTMKTAGLFGVVPAPYMTDVSCFFSDFLGAAMLVLSILALLDKKNGVPAGLVPIGIFVAVYACGACLGVESGFPLNPARDFGPRLLTSMVGYGTQVYTMRNQYWIWSPIMATSLGSQAAALVYDLFLYSGSDTLVHRLFGPSPRVESDQDLA